MKVHLTAQDNTWMMHHDAKAQMLKEGRYPDEMEMLMQTPSPPDTTQVEAWLQGTPRVEPSQIHIVVVWPKPLDFRVKDISEVFEHNALDRTLTYRRGLSFHVFIRESYAVIADRVLKEDNSVVSKYATVIGTPGIGKSYFRYLMWRLLSEKRRVFLFHEGGSVYFDGECLYDGCNVPGPLERFFWTPDLWCLVDATSPKERLDIHVANVSVVLTTTSRENFVDHMRALRPAPLSFVMPVWTESELAAIESWYPAAQRVWRDRLRVLGGVPRYVMEDISEAPATVHVRGMYYYSVTILGAQRSHSRPTDAHSHDGNPTGLLKMDSGVRVQASASHHCTRQVDPGRSGRKGSHTNGFARADLLKTCTCWTINQ